MPTTTFRFLVLAAACLATACQSPAPAAPAVAVAPAAAALVPTVSHAKAGQALAAQPGAGARIRLSAAIKPGGTRKLLAAVSEYTQADVAKLTLTISLQAPPYTPIASSDLLHAELADELTFSNLKNATDYRIQAVAYREVSPSVFEQISLDADSRYDFQVLQDDAVAAGTIPVQLAPVTFSGTATSGGLDVVSGGYSYPGTETIGHSTVK